VISREGATGSGDEAVKVSPGAVDRGKGTPPGDIGCLSPEPGVESMLLVLSRALAFSPSLLLSRSCECLLGEEGMDDIDMEACRDRGVAPGRPVKGLITSETTD
jgi:hypothetical protein